MKSNLVLAERWELLTPLRGTKSKEYDPKGQKELKASKKLVSREFVEYRNSIKNNEMYILFEEETLELMEERESNIKKNAENEAKSKLGINDLVDAIVNKEASKKSKPKKEVKYKEVETPKTNEVDFNEMNEEELKNYCDDNSIEYHHKAGKSKLIELINS